MLRTVFAFALLLVGPLLVAESLWLEDWTTALRASERSGKPILIAVTGSDWAPPSRRLEIEVFSRPEFAVLAKDKFVLMRVDLPLHNAQPEKIRAQNAKLTELWPVDQLPLTLISDKTGFIWGLQAGLPDGGPAAYVALADALVAQKGQIQQLQRDVETSPAGLEKARRLDALFMKVDEAGLAFEFGTLPPAVIAADKDNALGLANRYRVYAQYTRLLSSWVGRDDDAGVVKELTSMATKLADQPDLRQKILFTRGMVQWNALKDPLAAKATFVEALAVNGDGAGKTSVTARRIVDLLPALP